MRGDQCHREWVGKKGEQLKTKREENEKKMREEILSVTEVSGAGLEDILSINGHVEEEEKRRKSYCTL